LNDQHGRESISPTALSLTFPPEFWSADKFDISCYHATMNRQEIIDLLRKIEPTLRARGVSHAALFGSRARGDNRPDSDIDIMIEFDPAIHITVFNYAGLKDYSAGLFDGPVDVVNRDGLKPYVRPAATADAIYAF
jgi:predicted nucleotidyltransferase